MATPSKKPIAAAVGAFLASVTLSPLTSAADNPFQISPLSGGYSLAEKAEGEGKCGEGKCGEGKCGGKTETEGKCGEDKKAAAEGKCGEGKKAEGEGKCGGTQ